MSIERTTSANSTVTCLYSAEVAAGVIGEPHLLQNRESGGSSVPHDPHRNPVAVMPSPSIWPQRRHEDRSRQHRVTSCQPTCPISPQRSRQRVAHCAVPRGVGVPGRLPPIPEVAACRL